MTFNALFHYVPYILLGLAVIAGCYILYSFRKN